MIDKTSNEFERLDGVANHSLYRTPSNAMMIEYCFNIFARYLSGPAVLEMGPAEGIMTERLAQLAHELYVVEGSERFCDDIRRRLPSVNVTYSLFEEFIPDRQFNTIVLGHVLEHVEHPVDILRRVKKWLVPHSGRVLAAVPNSRSLHRQAAVVMGLLKFEEDMSELDIHHGHRRVYNPETFRRDFLSAGLQIDVFGGYWLKPVSNRQIEDTWTPEMLAAFMQLGERHPDIAAEIYIVGSSVR